MSGAWHFLYCTFSFYTNDSFFFVKLDLFGKNSKIDEHAITLKEQTSNKQTLLKKKKSYLSTSYVDKTTGFCFKMSSKLVSILSPVFSNFSNLFSMSCSTV